MIMTNYAAIVSCQMLHKHICNDRVTFTEYTILALFLLDKRREQRQRRRLPLELELELVLVKQIMLDATRPCAALTIYYCC